MRSSEQILAGLKPPAKLDLPDDLRRRLPDGTDWVSQPPLWAGQPADALSSRSGSNICKGATLHHDGQNDALALSGINGGLAIELSGFSGSFVSIALGFDEAAIASTGRKHLFRLETAFTVTAPLSHFARLNLVHGPNHETVPYEFYGDGPSHMVEWDLHFTDFDVIRAKDIWVDLIFESPADNRIEITDMLLLRHPRAVF